MYGGAKMKKLNINWGDVFNGGLKWWGVRDECEKMAFECGYKYFCFNDIVYEVNGNKTDITSSDLDSLKGKINIDDGEVVLTEIFNGIGLITENEVEIGICMRDMGFEINYNNTWYEAKYDEINKL